MLSPDRLLILLCVAKRLNTDRVLFVHLFILNILKRDILICFLKIINSSLFQKIWNHTLNEMFFIQTLIGSLLPNALHITANELMTVLKMS